MFLLHSNFLVRRLLEYISFRHGSHSIYYHMRKLNHSKIFSEENAASCCTENAFSVSPSTLFLYRVWIRLFDNKMLTRNWLANLFSNIRKCITVSIFLPSCFPELMSLFWMLSSTLNFQLPSLYFNHTNKLFWKENPYLRSHVMSCSSISQVCLSWPWDHLHWL